MFQQNNISQYVNVKKTLSPINGSKIPYLI